MCCFDFRDDNDCDYDCGSWYDLRKKGSRFIIQPTGAEITFLAGLYRYEEHSGKQIPMFSVITREAVEPVRSIHDRMPLMLKQEDVREWVRPNTSPSGITERALTDVIMEAASV